VASDLAATKQHLTAPFDTSFLPGTYDTYEVSTIANLHPQAVSIYDIRSPVTIVLDHFSNHSVRWRDLVQLTATPSTTMSPPMPLPQSQRMDIVIHSWIFETLTVEL
jgi:hypothetical protein